MVHLTPSEIHAELSMRMGEAQPEPRLSATRFALASLGDPQNEFPFIHVTGTNGKTTTSRLAESVLRAHGLHTALFTSPHLVDFTERICFDGAPIEADDLSRRWTEVDVALRRTDDHLRKLAQPPLTFFEALTVLAYTCFGRAGVDCAVIEVGMGGEWDSTNVADGRVAVVTPIALDHVAQLGTTVRDIAKTKSGIVKAFAHVVSSQQDAAALTEIQEYADRRGATLQVLGDDFEVSRVPDAFGQFITVIGLRHDYGVLHLPLAGAHQAQNAALAIAAVEAFLPTGAMNAQAVARGLEAARSPGRLTEIRRDPTVLVDVAHNPAGAAILATALGELAERDDVGLVLGILRDKDVNGIIAALSTATTTYFITEAASDRAMGHLELAHRVSMVDPESTISTYPTPSEALAAATDWAAATSGRIVVVTGSATIVGDIIKLKDAYAGPGDARQLGYNGA